MTFTSGSTTLCSVTVPATPAQCNTAALPGGTYPVTATYSGDANYAGSTATTSFTISRAGTSFTASANPGSTNYGNTVTLSVAGLPAGTTGNVTFTSGTTTLCTVTLPANPVSCTTGVLDTASYPVTATYSGDTNYAGATASTSFAITQASVSLTASASPTSTTYGNDAILTVTGLPEGATGAVTFTSGATTLCTVTLPSSPVSCTTGVLDAASYPVTATYSGDTDYAGTTASTSFAITQAASAIAASASPTPTSYGTPVTLTATNLPDDGPGTVTFTSGSTTLCTVTLPSIPASCSTGVVVTGDYSVTATYSGDTNYSGSTASTSFTIDQAVTAITASASPTSATYGNRVRLSATGLPSDATGTVTFSSGVSTLCTVTLPALPVVCSTGILDAADYPVTATYSGDSNYDSSTANTSFTVNQAPTSIAAGAAPGSTAHPNTVTLYATGLPVGGGAVDAPTGTITFTAGGSTLCT